MRLFIKVRRTLIDTYAYWQLLGRAKVSQNYWVGIVEDHDTETLQQAKRLHASVYLARDYITNDDIRDGIMHERADPYQNHASYFVVKKQGRVIATARQIIHIDGRAHHDIFPTLKETAVHERSRRHIVKLPVERIVEISALVKQPGESSIVPLVLYRAMWHHSLSRHSLWIMACDMRVYDRLKVLFGPAVRVIGKKTYYMGSYVMPVMLEPHGGLITLIKHAHVSLPVRRVINRQDRKSVV